MIDRIPCIVPYCRRTRKPASRPVEWICGKHWPMVDRVLKCRLARLKRLLRRCRTDRQWQTVRNHLDNVWERCKRQAIERAAGISA